MPPRDQIRKRVRPLVSLLRRLAYAGAGRECMCCGSTFRRFASAGRPRRPDAECPRCGARERHRLLTLELSRRPEIQGRVLHFAPEAATDGVIRGIATEYLSADIEETADLEADITALPFSDDRWDVIVCSHVLEHVPDDTSAMRELRRVLAPGGWAIVVVPRVLGNETDEDPTVTDAAERLRRFGQEDHVRMYGDDLEKRLHEAGFDTMEPLSIDHYSPEEIERYGLQVNQDGATDAGLFCSYE